MDAVRLAPRGTLTLRQREVLRLLAAGLSEAEAGAALGLARSTVRNHMQNVYDSLGLRGRRRCLVVATLLACATKQLDWQTLAGEALWQNHGQRAAR